VPPLTRKDTAVDLDAIRERLAVEGGRPYWRGLEELAETPQFQELMRREFPDDADQWLDPVTRRQFLVLMGASLALAGVAGCSARPAPHEQIMPYVHQPEEIIPGKPLFYATSMTLGGSGIGLLVESHEGRPTKVEGNPNHPASLGATDVFAQASVLGLYDPDRSATVRYRGRPRGWNDALAALRAAIDKLRARRGAGLRILTETVVSPSLGSQLDGLLRDFPEARWYQWEPAARYQAFAGMRQAFGDNTSVSVHYDLSKADVILSLDADFLYAGPGHLAYARQFADRRRVRVGRMPVGKDADPARFEENVRKAAMNRLYVVECAPTITGAKADHRLALRASEIESFARALVTLLGLPAGGASGPHDRWIAAVAKDLQQHRGRCVVLAGDGQPPAVHAIAHAINQHLGNFGKTVHFTRPVEHRPEDQVAGLQALTEDIRQNRVDLLFVMGANPVFTAPADLDFAGALARMKQGSLRVHLGQYVDETANACDWHLPEAHFLEAWSDTRAFDGTASLVQPLIAPLYGGRSAHEVLAFFTEYPERLGYEIVRDYWRDYHKNHGGGGDFEPFWQKGLRDGVLEDLAKEYSTPRTPTLRDTWVGQPPAGPLPSGQVEVVFAPDPNIYDGRFANNGWLQELPKPLTKLTWDNAALLSPATAEKYGLTDRIAEVGGEHGQIIVNLVQVQVGDRKLTLPAWIIPGHPDDCVTLHFGYGRKLNNLKVANGTGFNVYDLRRADAPWIDRATLGKAPGRFSLACVEFHHPLKNGEDFKSQAVIQRKPVHALTLAQFQGDPKLARFMTAGEHEEEEILSQMPGPYEGLSARKEAATEAPSQTEGKRELPPDRRLTPLTLYPQFNYSEEIDGRLPYRWAMGIDLTACVGCNACVVACQAENNIPVVGKDQVMRGREMHWLRVDRYYYPADGEKAGPDDLNRPLVFFQPVPCQQCEKAPCELVCPVEATAHSHDGLNDMTYNRCVGTRYCSNNCPYKVRRFNFLFYADFATESLKLQRNPDVTVRSRGVMEKCTYCVQRLREADITAEKRLVRALEAARQAAGGHLSPEMEQDIRRRSRVQDGEVMTACQQACPAGAIIFGDLNGPDRKGEGHSDVYRWKEEPTNYGLLAGLNTQPRTTYLAALRNPNPELI
jgi:molybdopterin-containing oxidoreductase family iron-sulfur binding subunit